MRYASETSKVRHLVEPYLKLPGIDIGFGGDKVHPEFDGSDLPNGYANTGDNTNDIPGDITKGLPVADETYQTVYSSHLIEDFEDTKAVIQEHLRILKPGGTLILVFPDEQKFRKHCKLTGQPYNSHHKHEDMGMYFVYKIVIEELDCKAVFYSDCDIDYNCVLVVQK